LITLPCTLVALLRAVFRRALHLGNRDHGPNLLLSAGPDGLRVRVRNSFAAAEYHLPGDFPAASVELPFAVLADCRGGKQDSLTLRQESPEVATAEWTDKQIPQVVQYDVKPLDSQEFPPLPEVMSPNDSSLWSALAAAVEVADVESVRYMLTCLRLRGADGEIMATDSRQLLRQTGYSFPWEEDLLIHRTLLFGCRGVVEDRPLSIGRSDDWLTLQSGPWTFHLQLEKQGRFPKAESLIPRQEDACCRVQLDPDDAVFLADALQRLPVPAESFLAVTIDLRDGVVIRANTGKGQTLMELVLSRSSVNGQRLLLCTDRDYLAHAARLGLHDLYFYGPDVPVQALDERRTYIWASLDADGVIHPSRKALRIDSAAAQTSSSTPSTRRPTTMATAKSRTSPEDAGNGNGSPHTNGEAHTPSNGQPAPASSDLIEQAEALRITLRTGVSQLSDLIAALKQQKKTTRSVQSALAALQQLQNVAL
jgi:hypothetical protein